MPLKPNKDISRYSSPIQPTSGELHSSNEPHCNQPDFPLDKYFKGDFLDQTTSEKISDKHNNMEL